ncbi:hypothetical protein HYPSUDRAFT_72168 [Hypholoma sublateritium FD-334 SS-4]|uniref:Uncharacterized protein n=1 Tax=Hypholoma sublateritium (strain FD-334 SS-4) TaxID=945553 RepID=A0A0D2NF16_HYPSF|nr:hypothetical protein HYPSUDRAFT_72168 [Hypholoma sublateritium FD-334 SS-4]
MSSSSSDSSPSSSPTSSPSLAQFDPFAVHPFTNCSAARGSEDPYKTGQLQSTAYPYGAPYASYPNRTVQSTQSPTYAPKSSRST